MVKATGAKIIEDNTSTSNQKLRKWYLLTEETDYLEEKLMLLQVRLTNKDGLNGKNANDKANALRNGEARIDLFIQIR